MKAGRCASNPQNKNPCRRELTPTATEVARRLPRQARRFLTEALADQPKKATVPTAWGALAFPAPLVGVSRPQQGGLPRRSDGTVTLPTNTNLLDAAVPMRRHLDPDLGPSPLRPAGGITPAHGQPQFAKGIPDLRRLREAVSLCF